LRNYSVIGRSAVRVSIDDKRFTIKFKSSYQNEAYYDFTIGGGVREEYSVSKIKRLSKNHPARIAYAGLQHHQWSEFKQAANDGRYGKGGLKEALKYLKM
jgi:hypothetical protein